MTSNEYLVLLSSFVNFGSSRLSLLLKYFGSAKRVWNAKGNELLETGLTEKIVMDFERHRENLDSKKYFGKLEELHISYITLFDSDYPINLKGIPYNPYVLYVKGKLKKSDRNAVALVGSRKMSAYGKEITQNFAQELASLGITIVSGLARGIDTEAHKSALNEGGRTIAVLACGLDQVYPPENQHLAGRIIESGSGIVSEYPIGTSALPLNFAARNRIISGLSKSVVVIEGRRKSGTLLTANHAAVQGREVFAVPGQINSPLSEAPLYLIQNGARMAVSVKDILDELDLNLKSDQEDLEKVLPETAREENILDSLELEPKHIDEIARETAVNVSGVSAGLMLLEIKGLVKNMGSGVYKRI